MFLPSPSSFSLSLCSLISLLSLVSAQQRPLPPVQDITPVPVEKFNPHITEFRRMDENKDEKVSFTEYLLADKHYIEEISREFHKLDTNGDGIISKEEYEGFYKKEDEERKERDFERDSFFKNRLSSPFNNHFEPLFHNQFMGNEMRENSVSSTGLPLATTIGNK